MRRKRARYHFDRLIRPRRDTYTLFLKTPPPPPLPPSRPDPVAAGCTAALIVKRFSGGKRRGKLFVSGSESPYYPPPRSLSPTSVEILFLYIYLYISLSLAVSFAGTRGTRTTPLSIYLIHTPAVASFASAGHESLQQSETPCPPPPPSP